MQDDNKPLFYILINCGLFVVLFRDGVIYVYLIVLIYLCFHEMYFKNPVSF